jgi:hypothetical protein
MVAFIAVAVDKVDAAAARQTRPDWLESCGRCKLAALVWLADVLIVLLLVKCFDF